MTILLAVLLLVGPAPAGRPDEADTSDTPDPSEEPTEASEPVMEPVRLVEDAAVEDTARERLDQAIRYYHSGHRDQARRALAELVIDDSVDDIALRQEARVYLGEVFLVQGDEESARKTWELVLEDDPDYRIDPFRHPPDVVGYFEVVRAYTIPIVDLDPTLRPVRAPTVPGLVFVPFGVYQLGHGRPGWGTLLLAGQASSLAASAVGFTALWIDHDYLEGSRDYDDLKTLRNVQWATTGAFWTLYIGGTASAWWRWNRDVRNQPTAAGLSIAPGGLRVDATF